MLGNCCRLLTFYSKLTFSKNSFRNTIRVSNSLDPDPARHFMKEMVKNLFWSIKNSGEILNKLKSRGFLASGLSTYDFSTLYTTLPRKTNRID